MTLKFSDENVLVNGYTLVLVSHLLIKWVNFNKNCWPLISFQPSVSVGNIGQLTVDIILSNTRSKKISDFYHDALIPVVSSGTGPNGITTAGEGNYKFLKPEKHFSNGLMFQCFRLMMESTYFFKLDQLWRSSRKKILWAGKVKSFILLERTSRGHRILLEFFSTFNSCLNVHLWLLWFWLFMLKKKLWNKRPLWFNFSNYLSLLKWAASSGIANIIMLSSISATERIDSQLKGTQVRHLSNKCENLLE